MSRSILTRSVLAVATSAAAVSLAACGTSDNSTAGPNSADLSKATQPAKQFTPQSSSPAVVGGPRPQTPAGQDTAGSDDEASGSGKTCGQVGGPDGALTVVITSGSVSCQDASKLADAYGPKIATGQPQTVDGWQCAPSQTPGTLASCSKDGSEIGFKP